MVTGFQTSAKRTAKKAKRISNATSGNYKKKKLDKAQISLRGARKRHYPQSPNTMVAEFETSQKRNAKKTKDGSLMLPLGTIKKRSWTRPRSPKRGSKTTLPAKPKHHGGRARNISKKEREESTSREKKISFLWRAPPGNEGSADFHINFYFCLVIFCICILVCFLPRNISMMYLVNRLETNWRKLLIPFHAIWGLCWYIFLTL